MSLANFHTHTCFCDGSAAPIHYVDEAISQGFSALGFSAHAPLHFENAWSLKSENKSKYCREIKELKSAYRNKIDIFLGYEADYIPGFSPSFDQIKKDDDLDYIIGAVHLVQDSGTNDLWFIDGPQENFDGGLRQIFSNDIRKAVGCYFYQLMEMIETQNPDIVAHFDKVKMNNRGRYFSETELWYRDLLMSVLEKISKAGCIVEINTRGIYTGRFTDLYPAKDLLKIMKSLNIPVILSSDAHKPGDISSYFSQAKEILIAAGYRSQSKLTEKGWTESPL